MSNPISPNYKKGVGQLATSRFDFQDHIDGNNFRHQAGQIDLFPTVVIGSTTTTDVQSAIAALAASIVVPFVPDATTSSKGIIRLGGDLAGTGTTALSPRVSGLQGYTVSLPTTPGTNNVLTWNGSAWISAPIVPATSSVSGTILLAGDLAGVGSSAATPRVGAIQGFPVTNTAPSTGQALVWNGSIWTPTGIPTSPSGTGFATVTSGTYDATATANLKYAAGKFQTSVNIQYLSSGITGDLAWTPTSTNKTLTLPNATDTLVAQSTTDTLSNKTINATNNTITDTSAALGDILAVISGTKFTRLAKGANGSFLGVSGGVVGYYTPSSSTPSGTGFATVTGGVYDSNATANIRYTGGKFQTDANIQYNTGGFTGDLSWAISGSNKVLGLPNANDTLVGQSTTDTLINKTINASNNTITDTSTATGDLLKSNGTSFVRFAKGSALQVLRVNAGATDLEWAASSSGSSSVGVVNSVQLSDGSGGFLANGTLGLSSGGTLKLNISATAIEHLIPVAGYAGATDAFRYQLATVNATTISGPYTPTGTEAASPIWVVTNGSFDGYINLPAQSGATYLMSNTTGNTINFRATGDAGVAAVVNANKNAIVLHNGTRYITFISS